MEIFIALIVIFFIVYDRSDNQYKDVKTDKFVYTSYQWRSKGNIISKKLICKKRGLFFDRKLCSCSINFKIKEKDDLKYISEYKDKSFVKNIRKMVKSAFKNADLENFSILAELSLDRLSQTKHDIIKVIIFMGKKERYAAFYSIKRGILYPVDPLSSYDLFRILSQNNKCEISFTSYDDEIHFIVDNSDRKELSSFLKEIRS